MRVWFSFVIQPELCWQVALFTVVKNKQNNTLGSILYFKVLVGVVNVVLKLRLEYMYNHYTCEVALHDFDTASYR